MNGVSLLEYPEEDASECGTANGGSLSISWRGSVVIVGTVMGKAVKVKLKAVYYVENLELTFIS